MKNKIITQFIITLFIAPFLVTTIFGQPIYLVENQSAKVSKSEINGTNLTQLKINSIGLYGIASDYVNKKIYFSNVVTDEIFRTELDGSNAIVILNKVNNAVDGPRGIAVDYKNNKIYWAESISGKIRSANLDGSNASDIVIGLSSPVDVALDLVNNKIYWSDNGVGQKKISKSDLSVISPVDVITGLNQVAGIEIDVENNKLYWADFGLADKISRTDLTTISPQVVSSITTGSPRDIAIDRNSGKLFWTDVLDNSISKIKLDLTSQSKIISGLSSPIGISGDNPATLPLLVNLKIMLEGPYNGTNMNANLSGTIPLIAPYSANNRIVDNIPVNIADWVLVELRENLNGPTIISKSALLNKDGRIVADDGTTGTIKISADPKPYFIVIKHRNHLPIMSAAAVNLTTN